MALARDRGKEWLARVSAVLWQIDVSLATQFDQWVRALQLNLSSYTTGPIWNQVILSTRSEMRSRVGRSGGGRRVRSMSIACLPSGVVADKPQLFPFQIILDGLADLPGNWLARDSPQPC